MSTNQATQRSSELSLQLSQIDKQIEVNLKHEIEFGNFDALRGYKKLTEFQDMLKERRKVKDELFSLSLILNNSIRNHVTGDVVKGIEGLKNRKFKYRVFEKV